jgi:1,2-phenylacetyl-CoA epoxidase PaaB subunit
MGWTKREPVSNLVVLGDDDGQVKKVGGLLAAMKQDTMYPARNNYEIIQKDGTSLWLAGSASIGRQLGSQDVGKFVKCEFMGWGKAKQGKFKEIDVVLWDGEPTDDMKKWPRWKEISTLAKNGNGTPKQDEPPPHTDDDQTPDDEDDGLPF